MKKIKIAALILAGLMTVGSLGACVSDTPGHPNEDGEQTTSSGASNNGNQSSNNGNSNNNGNNSSNNSGNNEITQNYTIDSIEDFNEGIIVYRGTITTEDGSQTVGYGYINSKGQAITPPIYEKAYVFYKGLAAVEKGNNQKGYIDITGKEVIPCIYSSVATAMDTLAWVTTADGVEQVINTKGEAVYTATGKETAKGYYQNGFFWIETKEEKISGDVYTMTYYNEKGEVAFKIEDAQHVQDSKYVDAANLGNSNFAENGYAIITLKQRYEYYEGSGQFTTITRNWFVDTKGEIVDLEWDENARINSDLASVREIEAGNWYIIETAGPVQSGGYAHYIDWDKQIAHGAGFEFGRIQHLGEDYYVLMGDTFTKYSGSTAIVRGYTGKEFLNFRAIEAFGGAKVMSTSYQKINGQDAFVLFLRSTSEVGYVSVIDFSGNVLVEPVKAWIGEPVYQYGGSFLIGYTINPVCAGLISAQDQDTQHFGYIDLTGNWVIPAQYESATDFYGEGDSAVAVVNGDTLINRKGEVLFSTNGQN